MDIQKVGNMYICNECGELYNLEDAYRAKGNSYFCSMACVLKYDKYIDEITQEK